VFGEGGSLEEVAQNRQFDEPGRTFRVIPREIWSVENNLSISNMDYHEFADNIDSDGVFRGFLRTWAAHATEPDATAGGHRIVGFCEFGTHWGAGRMVGMSHVWSPSKGLRILDI
jgi:hypothetical protein